jgi:MFS family permease
MEGVMDQNKPIKRSSVFYGWVIAVAAGLGIAFSVSVWIPSTIGIMASHLVEEFGWTMTQIYVGASVAAFVTILVAPFLGAIVDRFGARPVIAFSFIIEALLIASYYYLNSNIYLFFMRYGALAILATGTTAVPFAKILSRWFDRRRGLALGVALACYGLGGVMWSKGTQVLFDLVGWRNSFLYMGGVILFIVLPILLIIIRDTPESKGLTVDGLPESAEAKFLPKADTTGLSLSEAVRGLQFWKIAFGFFFAAFAIQGIMQHIVPMMKLSGISAQTAASVQALLWLAMVFGRVTTGGLMDHIFAPRVAMIFLIPAIIGVFILSSSGLAVDIAIIGAVCIGLANGSEADVVPYVTGRYYGLKYYTKIYGTFFSCFCLGCAFGPIVTAKLVDSTGGYHVMVWTHTAALIAAGLIFLTFKRFPSSFSK